MHWTPGRGYPWLQHKQLAAKVINQCPNLFFLPSFFNFGHENCDYFFADALRCPPASRSLLCPHTRTHIHRDACEFVTEQYDFCITCNAHWITHHHHHIRVLCRHHSRRLLELGIASLLAGIFLFPFIILTVNQRRRTTHAYTRSEHFHTVAQTQHTILYAVR